MAFYSKSKKIQAYHIKKKLTVRSVLTLGVMI